MSAFPQPRNSVIFRSPDPFPRPDSGHRNSAVLREMMLLLLCMTFIIAGCTDTKPIPRVTKSSIDAKQLEGRWEISDASMLKLTKMGISIYTNRQDHVLQLDGEKPPSFNGYGGSYNFALIPSWEESVYDRVVDGTNSQGIVYSWTNFVYRNEDFGLVEAVALVQKHHPNPDTSPYRFYVGVDTNGLYLSQPLRGDWEAIRFNKCAAESTTPE